jgi:hypothetical protein
MEGVQRIHWEELCQERQARGWDELDAHQCQPGKAERRRQLAPEFTPIWMGPQKEGQHRRQDDQDKQCNP